MRNPVKLALTLLLIAVSFPSSAADWALMAREGGCHPIASLLRRLPDLPDIRDPDGFERYVRAKGWAYARKAHAAGTGQAVEFVVEGQGLALLFATRELCAASSGQGGR